MKVYQITLQPTWRSRLQVIVFVQWSTLGEHGDYHGDCEDKFGSIGLVYDGINDECGAGGDPYDGGRGVKKLSYYTKKLLIEKSRGCEGVEGVETGIPNVRLFYLKRNGRYVVWWDYSRENLAGESKEVILSLPRIGVGAVNVTAAIPSFSLDFQTRQNRLREKDYPRFFNSSSEHLDENRFVVLTLGRSPVYVEGE